MESEGYVYVDVRSVPEFQAGHPAGAYNVPLLNMGPGGMQPNPDFMKVMETTFAKDAKLVMGCKSGGRSLRAAHLLKQSGYTDVVDQLAGFEGARDGFGQLQEPGWRPAGLSVSTDAEKGRSYEELHTAASKG